MKIDKRLKNGIRLGLISAILGGSCLAIGTHDAHAQDYSDIPLTKALPTAFMDQINENNKMSKEEKDSVNDKGGDYLFNKKLDENAAALINSNYGNFSNVGVLVGPVDNKRVQSTFDNTVTIPKKQLGKWDKLTNGKFTAYYEWGKAIRNLRQRGIEKRNIESDISKITEVVNGLSNTVAGFGIQLVKWLDPTVLINALYDKSVSITDVDNVWVQIVNHSEGARTIINTVAAPVGNTGLSWMQFVTIAMVIVMACAYILLKFLGASNWGMSARKLLVKILVVTTALPVGSMLMAKGTNFLTTVNDNSKNAVQDTLISTNLLFYHWASSYFRLPPDVGTIAIEKGQFAFTPEQIVKINKYAIAKTTGPEYEKVTDKMVRDTFEEAGSAMGFGNVTGMKAFPISTPASGVSADDGKTFKTEHFYKAIQEFGDGKEKFAEEYAANKADASGKPAYGSRIGYLNGTSTMTKVGSHSWQWNPNSTKNDEIWTVSPLAAQNVLSTDFNGDIQFLTNAEKPTAPPVVPDLLNIGAGEMNMPSFVRTIIQSIMVWHGIMAILAILKSGLGGILEGGASSLIGSASGWGRLLGGIGSLVIGIVGISIILTFTVFFADTFYGAASGLNWDVASTLTDTLFELLDKINLDVPVIGWLVDAIFWGLKQIVKCITAGVVAILLIIATASLVKGLIKGYGLWASSWPTKLAEKFSQWEDNFIRGYSMSGAGVGGGMSHAFDTGINSQERDFNARKEQLGEAGRTVTSVAAPNIGGAVAATGIGAAKGLFNKLSGGSEDDSIHKHRNDTMDDSMSENTSDESMRNNSELDHDEHMSQLATGMNEDLHNDFSRQDASELSEEDRDAYAHTDEAQNMSESDTYSSSQDAFDASNLTDQQSVHQASDFSQNVSESLSESATAYSDMEEAVARLNPAIQKDAEGNPVHDGKGHYVATNGQSVDSNGNPVATTYGDGQENVHSQSGKGVQHAKEMQNVTQASDKDVSANSGTQGAKHQNASNKQSAGQSGLDQPMSNLAKDAQNAQQAANAAADNMTAQASATNATSAAGMVETIASNGQPMTEKGTQTSANTSNASATNASGAKQTTNSGESASASGVQGNKKATPKQTFKDRLAKQSQKAATTAKSASEGLARGVKNKAKNAVTNTATAEGRALRKQTNFTSKAAADAHIEKLEKNTKRHENRAKLAGAGLQVLGALTGASAGNNISQGIGQHYQDKAARERERNNRAIQDVRSNVSERSSSNEPTPGYKPRYNRYNTDNYSSRPSFSESKANKAYNERWKESSNSTSSSSSYSTGRSNDMETWENHMYQQKQHEQHTQRNDRLDRSMRDKYKD